MRVRKIQTKPAKTPRKALVTAMLLLGVAALAWGGSWPVMKIIVSQMPIFSFRMLTAWGGGATVLMIAWVMGYTVRLERRDIGPAIVAGLLNITGWLYFTALGLTMLPAGRATVLAYTMPLWAFLAAIILTGERVTARRITALGFGLGAVLILGGDDLIRLGAVPLGVIATLAAAASWGLGTVVQKKTRWRTPLLTLAGWQLLIGGTPLAILAITQDTAPFANLTTLGVAAMVYIVLIGTVLGYWAWFRALQMIPGDIAALGILPAPMIGVISSALLLNEPLGWPELAAVALLTAALATMLYRQKKDRGNSLE
jgi:drug/metabolite transporter (DMT)-like permease